MTKTNVDLIEAVISIVAPLVINFTVGSVKKYKKKEQLKKDGIYVLTPNKHFTPVN